MKKLIALFLAILMIASVALVACNNKKGTTGDNGGNNADTEDNGGLVIPDNFGTSADTTGTGTGSAETSDKASNNNNNQATSGTFVDVAVPFPVYTYVSTNIRKDASMKSSAVATVDALAELTVIAENETTRWYKVKSGSNEGYVSYDFVTKVKGETEFVDFAAEDYKTIQIVKGEGEKPYQLNIRQYPIVSDLLTADDMKKVTLTFAETSEGQLLKIGENATGNWYKVSYNNEIYYLAVNSTTKPLLLVDGQALGSGSSGI